MTPPTATDRFGTHHLTRGRERLGNGGWDGRTGSTQKTRTSAIRDEALRPGLLDALTRHLRADQPGEPLVIGGFGAWGSGKTKETLNKGPLPFSATLRKNQQ